MKWDEFLTLFKAGEVVVRTDDSDEFEELCAMLEEAGFDSWNHTGVYNEARYFRKEYPYLGRSIFDKDADSFMQTASWGNSCIQKKLELTSLEFLGVYKNLEAEASGLLEVT